MAKEYMLSYTAQEINEKLAKIDNLPAVDGSGITTAQTNSLWAILQKTAFTTPLTSAELSAFKTAWGYWR